VRSSTPEAPPAPTQPQPIEPLFIPKLQSQFADFPCLLSSVRLEAANLEDLMRIRYGCREESWVPDDFQGSSGAVLRPVSRETAHWGASTGSPSKSWSAVERVAAERVLRGGPHRARGRGACRP